MKSFAYVCLWAVVAQLASAGDVIQPISDTKKKEPCDMPLWIDMKMDGNTKVKAIVTNHNKCTFKAFKHGTFLDADPVEKIQIVDDCKSDIACFLSLVMFNPYSYLPVLVELVR